MRQLYLFISLIISFSLYGQEMNQSYCKPAAIDSLPAGSLQLKVSNNNFLKNNEYFNRYTEGITWFGSMIQPEIQYAFSSKARLSAGWFLRYYYGRDKINTSLPVFRFEYDFLPGARLTFGQITGQLDHQLIEPIYNSDNYFKRNPEYGIQLRVNKTRVQSDVWISWEHFIMPGENSKEEISAGINISYQLLYQADKNNLAFNLQGIVHHLGGQVDISNSPLETRINLAPGIEYTIKTDKSLLKDIRFAAYLIQSSDQSGNVTIPYKKGFAGYSYLMLQNKWVSFVAAYFHGEYYFSPLGDKLFQSVSELNDWYAGDTRDLLNGKLMFDREITKGVKLGIRFESYFDLNKGNMDYCYGMNIKTDLDWLLCRKR